MTELIFSRFRGRLQNGEHKKSSPSIDFPSIAIDIASVFVLHFNSKFRYCNDSRQYPERDNDVKRACRSVSGITLSGVIALAMVGSAVPVQAQQVGDRVRVFLPDSTAVGQVTAVSDDRFEIVRDSTLFSFEFQSVESLDRSTGTKRLGWEGLLVGASIPLSLGGKILVGCGEAVDSEAGAVVFFLLCFPVAATLVVVGTPIGAVVGGIVGIFIHREEWEPIPLDDRTGRLSLILPRFGLDGHIGLDFGVRIRIP